jgi:uncharacterized membrane protein
MGQDATVERLPDESRHADGIARRTVRVGEGPSRARRSARRRLLRARRRLRAEFAQLLCALTGLALGLALPQVDGGPMLDGSRLAQPLVTLGVGVIGVVSIIYSLLFGVVQWSASAFTPRLNLFHGDPLVWRTFAFAIGLFVFCLTGALAIDSSGGVSVLVPATAILATLVAIALIRGLQTRAFLSLQLAHVLQVVETKGRAVIADVYPVRSPVEVGTSDTAAPLPPVRRTVSWTGPSCLIQQLELRRLVTAAAQADAVLAFRVGVGDTLHDGSALADLHGGELPDPVVRKAVVRGPERSFDQDPMFAVRLLADIGLRALSPAVNDPATAVDAIEATEGLLRTLAARDLTVTDVTDSAGGIRVRLVLPTWEDYLRTGIEDLIPASTPFAMVLGRLQQLLANLLETSPPPAHAPLIQLSGEIEALRATLKAGRR